MPKPPHNFPTLVGSNNEPGLVLGAGASAGISYLPIDLLAQTQKNRSVIEQNLQCNSSAPLSTVPELYEWADDVLNQLQNKGAEYPRLDLAQALGLTTDPKWKGIVPLRGTSPRHRVIARLAREKKWKAIWSLNWDSTLENAFKRVGLTTTNPNPELPWPTAYLVYTDPVHFLPPTDPSTIVVYKPHGCVEEITSAATKRSSGQAISDPIFTIAASAMNALSGNAASFVHICAIFSQRPLVALGWSASEPYMLQALEQVKIAGGLLSVDTTPDALSIIDLEFNPGGHAQLANLYQVPSEQALVEVLKKGDYTSDDLFLWLQTLYALKRLLNFCAPALRIHIQHQIDSLIVRPCLNDRAVSWADNFLPVWVRTCWRAGLVPYVNLDGQLVPSDQIPCDLRDEHIPIQLPGIDRPDLRSAASLLIELISSVANWDTQHCPGALWDSDEAHLVVPIPAWPDDPASVNLRALKPIFEHDGRAVLSRATKVSVLPLPQDPTSNVDPHIVSALKALLARQMNHAQFANPNNIGIMNLEDL